jgi:hypothetical protein
MLSFYKFLRSFQIGLMRRAGPPGLCDLMAVMKEFDNLLDAYGDAEAEDIGGDVEEKVVSRWRQRVDVSVGSLPIGGRWIGAFELVEHRF